MEKIKYFILLLMLMFQSPTFGQEDNRKIYIDSIKTSKWPHVFPAWGQRLTKRGVDLPYPVGIMVNYLTSSQKVNISDLQVGINNSPMVPLDFIEFGEVEAKVETVNMRVDVWLLPFVDLYGIAGKTWAHTSVSIVSPVNFTSKVDFNGETYGTGVTLGGAYKHIFGTLDYNHTWTHLDKIEGAIHAQTLSPRFGYIFQSRSNPNRNLGLWVGATGVFVNRETAGIINLGDIGANGNAADFDIEDAPWYQDLKPGQKLIVKQIADKIKDKIDNIDVSDTTISYSLRKKASSPWSMTIGAQYQFSHNLQIRTEAGFFGGHKSLLASVNYRFGF